MIVIKEHKELGAKHRCKSWDTGINTLKISPGPYIELIGICGSIMTPRHDVWLASKLSFGKI